MTISKTLKSLKEKGQKNSMAQWLFQKHWEKEEKKQKNKRYEKEEDVKVEQNWKSQENYGQIKQQT